MDAKTCAVLCKSILKIDHVADNEARGISNLIVPSLDSSLPLPLYKHDTTIPVTANFN